ALPTVGRVAARVGACSSARYVTRLAAYAAIRLRLGHARRVPHDGTAIGIRRAHALLRRRRIAAGRRVLRAAVAAAAASRSTAAPPRSATAEAAAHCRARRTTTHAADAGTGGYGCRRARASSRTELRGAASVVGPIATGIGRSGREALRPEIDGQRRGRD